MPLAEGDHRELEAGGVPQLLHGDDEGGAEHGGVPPLEEEDAFTAKRFSGTKYIRKQRGDDHQNHF